jgi:hypothetical protein
VRPSAGEEVACRPRRASRPARIDGTYRGHRWQLVADATEIVARISEDPSQAGRTWVLLTEAAEGPWGIAGTAFGREEFAALLR